MSIEFKTKSMKATLLFVILIIALIPHASLTTAQTPASAVEHYSKDGLSFDLLSWLFSR
jgi:hypothetical protein